MICLLAEINSVLAVELTLDILLAEPTIAGISREIERNQQWYMTGKQAIAQSFSDIKMHSLFCLNQVDEKPNLFLIHPIGGTVFCYLQLCGHLQHHFTIYAIQDPGIYTKRYMFSDYKDMASYYCDLIQAQQDQGPYYIAGASFGANMSVEVSRQLQQRGCDVPYTAMFDGWAYYPAKAISDRRWFENNVLRHHVMLKEKFADAIELPKVLLDLQWQRQQLQTKHKVTAIDFPLILLKSAIVSPVLTSIDAQQNHWDRYVKDKFTCITVPGDHESMLFDPHAKVLAEAILQTFKALKD